MPDYVPQIDPRVWSPEAYRIAFDAFNLQNVNLLGAFQGAELVGIAAFRQPDTLMSLSVKYQNKGIGSRLLAVIQKGGGFLVTSSRAAEKFYEKQGLSHIGEKKGEKVYQWRL